MRDPDRPLPPEHYDGCTCGTELYSDPDCAVHAPRYRLTLSNEELE